jgi:hypothetical protein
MLRRYRRACDHRRWDKGIDSKAIITHVERLIRIIEKKGDAWNYI